MTNKSIIAAALKTPESDVPEPKRTRQSSFSAQVKDLDVGEIAVKAVALDAGKTVAESIDLLQEKKQSIREGVAPMVSRLQAANGTTYTVTTSDTLTPQGYVAMVLVRRTA